MGRPSWRAPIELLFVFDFSCPYAYLASTRVEATAARTGATLDPQPILLGGVFRALGTAQNLAATMGEGKARHDLLDMQRWAHRFDTPLSMHPRHPVRTVTALRALLASPRPWMPLIHRFYRACQVEHRDLDRDEVVADVLREAGLDPGPILVAAGSETIRQELRERTDRALAQGVFGVPAFPQADGLLWGRDRLDRLDRLERLLGGAPPRTPPVAARVPVDMGLHGAALVAASAQARDLPPDRKEPRPAGPLDRGGKAALRVEASRPPTRGSRCGENGNEEGVQTSPARRRRSARPGEQLAPANAATPPEVRKAV